MTPEQKAKSEERIARYNREMDEKRLAKDAKKTGKHSSSQASTPEASAVNSAPPTGTPRETPTEDAGLTQAAAPPVAGTDEEQTTGATEEGPKVQNVGSGESTYTPFNENPTERDYTKPAGSGKPGEIADIPEPVFTPPTATVAPKSDPKVGPNPDLTQATADEKRKAAEQLVDVGLNIYDWAHKGGRWLAKVKPEKLSRLAMEDKIDLSLSVQDGKGGTITIGALFDSFNAQIDNTIVLDQTFRDKVREPLIRICIKNGWGLTDEQYVLVVIGEDLVTKVSLAGALMMTANKMLDAFTKMHIDNKKARTAPGNAGNKNQQQPSPEQPKKPEGNIQDAEIIEPEEAGQGNDPNAPEHMPM